MKRKKPLRVFSGIIVALVIIFISVWAAFVPWAKEPGYVFVKTWGEKGTGPGQFHDPTGLAIASDEIFVADARNARIQVFDFGGNFKRQFGSKGKGPGQLGRPMNLTVYGGELYVADYWNDRIQVFALDGTPKRAIGSKGSGPGQFNAPGGIAVASKRSTFAEKGDLFVADFYNQRVQHLRANGQFVIQWGITGKVGIWAGEFNYPTDVALGRDGILFVADGYNDRVQAFNVSGPLVRKWGGPFAMNVFGPFNGWFATITSIVVGPKGNIFTADFYNHRVQKFASDGT
ncbi:MAG: NHL repeat-containing protein, partial [Haliea sp.]